MEVPAFRLGEITLSASVLMELTETDAKRVKAVLQFCLLKNPSKHYELILCNFIVSPCAAYSRCQNGGTCVEKSDGSLMCSCPRGFFGKFCGRFGTLCEA